MNKIGIFAALKNYLPTVPIINFGNLGIYGAEFGGELPSVLVNNIVHAGADVRVYRHKGTVSTVVTW